MMAMKNVAVMFTDIKGYSARVSDSDREALSHLLDVHDRLLRPVFHHFRGNIIKTIGDAFLVTFESPTDAVVCGMTIQEVLRQHNESCRPDDLLEIRVAINSGEVEVTRDDIFGETVNIAARLESAAEAGEVWFTESVFLSMNRNEAPSAEIGERTFKGIPFPVRVYRANLEPDAVKSKLERSVKLEKGSPVIEGLVSSRSKAKPRRTLVAISGLVLLTIAIGATYFFTRDNPQQIAIKKARVLNEQERYGAALDALSPFLGEGASEEAKSVALKSAKLRVAQLKADVNAKEALEFVRLMTKESAWAHPLRDLVPGLEGASMATRIQSSKNPWPLVNELLAKFPKNPDAPYCAAQSSEDMRFKLPALTLYVEAGNRGAFQIPEQKERAVEFATRLFANAYSDRRQKILDLLSMAWGEEDLKFWLESRLKETESARELNSAFQFLKRHEHPITKERYFHELNEIFDGFDSPEEADASFAFFREIKAAERRAQVLKIHQWILHPTGSWGGRYRKLVERNHNDLKRDWQD